RRFPRTEPARAPFVFWWRGGRAGSSLRPMKNLHEPAVAAEMRARLSRVQPGSPALWGKMNVAQGLAHMANALEMALGDDKPPRMFAGRLFGRFVKRLVLRDESPLKRNTPTA